MSASTPAEGHHLTDAEALFRQILSDHPAAHYAVQGWGGAKLRDFCEPNGWLGLWMLKTEVSSMALFGCRLWDVVYQASDKAAEGIMPISREQIDLDAQIGDSYDRAMIADKACLTAGLRYMLAQNGLLDSIIQRSNTVSSSPLVLPGYTESLSVGDILPFPSETDCLGVLLSDFSSRVHRELAIIRARRDRDSQPGVSR